MAQQTAQSVTATPGRVHTFVAKTAVVDQPIAKVSLEWSMSEMRLHYAMDESRLHYSVSD